MTKVSSMPLFGSPTPKEVEAIENHMHERSVEIASDVVRARKFLEDIGAIADDSDADDDQAVGVHCVPDSKSGDQTK